jgi:fatty-acyl-CoA synthase
MQHDHPLTICGIVERMRTVNAASAVTSVADDGQTMRRATFAEIGNRVDRLCAGLRGLGVQAGDRVATFCWNRQEHLEAYLPAPSMGAVLHTVKLRLFADQLTYVVNHAEDRVMLVDASLVPVLEPIAPRFETVTHYVVIGDGDPGALARHGEVSSYEHLLAGSTGFDYPELDDRAACALCYTTGTTGSPKGVLYSHRSNYVHSLAICLPDALGVCSDDIVLPVVPMFHANAWGMPYACGLVGADLVLTNRFLQPSVIASLIEQQRVPLALAVPTIWMDLLRYADEHHPDLSSLPMVPCGGTATPRSLIEAFEDRHGVPIVPVWGMTETSPLGAVTHVPRGVSREARWPYKLCAGRIARGHEARLVDEVRSGCAMGRGEPGRTPEPRAVGRLELFQGSSAGEASRRLVAHPRCRGNERRRTDSDHRPRQGRRQVRRRVDLLGGARERADVASGGPRGRNHRQAR